MCGQGSLFCGLLTVVTRCPICDFSFESHDAGDGPVFFAISISAIVVTLLAVWVELAYAPPMWMHLVLWSVVILLLSIGILRVSTAALIGLQYRHERKDET